MKAVQCAELKRHKVRIFTQLLNFPHWVCGRTAAETLHVDVLLLEDLLMKLWLDPLYGQFVSGVVSPERPNDKGLILFIITHCTVIRGLTGPLNYLSFSCVKTKVLLFFTIMSDEAVSTCCYRKLGFVSTTVASHSEITIYIWITIKRCFKCNQL